MPTESLPVPDLATLAGGCFWCLEAVLEQVQGVESVVSGYANGVTPAPTYQQVCRGNTGHAEVVLVVFDPEQISYESLLRVFWENHDTTQGNRQGNDIGEQYRSVIMTGNAEQESAARESLRAYQQELDDAGYGPITTEILPVSELWYAEDYHQQYLAKNPAGYCGLGGTGVSCPVGVTASN